MPGTRGMVQLIVVTTVGDGTYRRDQPRPVIFDKALRRVRDVGNQEPFAPEYTNGEPSGLPRTTANQDGPRSDGCLGRRAPRLLLGRAPKGTGQPSGHQANGHEGRGDHSGAFAVRGRERVVVTMVDLPVLLGDLDDTVKNELASTPEVVDVGDDLDVGDLPIVARRWHKVSDAVAVVADLKNSTKLGTGKWAASTASIYEASTGSVVRIFDEFDADFSRSRATARSGSSGVNVATSVPCVRESRSRHSAGPWLRGLRSAGRICLRPASRWAWPAAGCLEEDRYATQSGPAGAGMGGKAVNYAAKAAQGTDRHIMVVTGSVWDRAEKNDYLAISCPCGTGPSLGIWEDTEITRLPDGDPEAQGRALTAAWCGVHGEEYCAAVLEGKRSRRDVDQLRKALAASQMRNAIRLKAKNERTALLARRRGLAS